MKNYILYIAAIFLLSCSSQKPVSQELPQVYPQKPAPMYIASVKWQVRDANVCLSSKDGLNYNLQRKDTIRYIKDLQSRLCYLGDEKYCKKSIENAVKP